MNVLRLCLPALLLMPVALHADGTPPPAAPASEAADADADAEHEHDPEAAEPPAEPAEPKPPTAQQRETMATRALRQLIEQQKDILAEAAKNPNLDQGNFQSQMEQICSGYEQLLRANPKFADAFAAYGYLLGKLGQTKQSIAMLLKANQLDPNMPLVKNQIGNFLAEEGKPLEAVSYYMSAIKLAPKEPLYHYQLGTLLYEARDEFLLSGEWKREAIDHAIHQAFRQAAELAPDRIEFTYRYAESFYDLNPPDWEAALKEWSKLEENAPTPIERETMRLHAANILIKQHKFEHARAVLDTVTAPELQKTKAKLVAQIESPEPAK